MNNSEQGFFKGRLHDLQQDPPTTVWQRISRDLGENPHTNADWQDRLRRDEKTPPDDSWKKIRAAMVARRRRRMVFALALLLLGTLSVGLYLLNALIPAPPVSQQKTSPEQGPVTTPPEITDNGSGTLPGLMPKFAAPQLGKGIVLLGEGVREMVQLLDRNDTQPADTTPTGTSQIPVQRNNISQAVDSTTPLLPQPSTVTDSTHSNPPDVRISNKDRKQIKQPHKSDWLYYFESTDLNHENSPLKIGYFFSPELYRPNPTRNDVNLNEDYLRLRKLLESPALSYSMGVQTESRLKENWNFVAGLWYQHREVRGNYVYNELKVNKKEVYDSVSGTFVTTFDTLKNIRLNQPGTLVQNGFQIPLGISRTFGERRFSFEVAAGATFNYIARLQGVFLNPSDLTVLDVKTPENIYLRRWSMGYFISAGMNYQLSHRLSFSIMPTWRGITQSQFSNVALIRQVPYSAGINFGLRIHY